MNTSWKHTKHILHKIFPFSQSIWHTYCSGVYVFGETSENCNSNKLTRMQVSWLEDDKKIGEISRWKYLNYSFSMNCVCEWDSLLGYCCRRGNSVHKLHTRIPNDKSPGPNNRATLSKHTDWLTKKQSKSTLTDLSGLLPELVWWAPGTWAWGSGHKVMTQQMTTTETLALTKRGSVGGTNLYLHCFHFQCFFPPTLID